MKNLFQTSFTKILFLMIAFVFITGCEEDCPLTSTSDPTIISDAKFTDMNFTHAPNVYLDLGSYVVETKIEGELLVSEKGDINGTVTINWNNLLSDPMTTIITFEGSDATMTTNGETLTVMPDSSNHILVNGEIVPVFSILDEAILQMVEVNDPENWSNTTLNLAALSTVYSTYVFQNNMGAAQLLAANPSFWCKLGCIAVGAIVAALLTAGCAAILAGCTGATTITLGGVLVPCTWAVAVCGGGIFAGSAAAYEAWLEFVWGG